ncbi:hypothetical protein [Actinomadura parmotrematis]|uniref:Uncharacterized protein n=1 Tax=Actinomadura parmotrematis TaxID=2864039 RepID=A0ABS7FMH4_9ACTN|nr:hypothetical protein [Actinomadura parmotrematis]MBW8480969.1 hypothetical protein [Actinomadura parmotrematis]
MRPTPARPPAPTRALALAAAAAAPLALAAPAAHAATTTWKVVNPAADGRYASTTTAGLTARNAAGKTIFTCAEAYQQGTLASVTSTAASPLLAKADYTAATSATACKGPNGEQGMLLGGTIASIGVVYYSPTGYDAATGTTSLIGKKSVPIGISFLADDCRFDFDKITATYTNGTRVLKYTGAVAHAYTNTNADGSVGCPGVTTGGTLTFTGGFTLDSAVTITRTTA